MNLQIAQVYLQHGDPTLASRTWQNVMDAMAPLKTGPTQARWIAANRVALRSPGSNRVSKNLPGCLAQAHCEIKGTAFFNDTKD